MPRKSTNQPSFLTPFILFFFSSSSSFHPQIFLLAILHLLLHIYLHFLFSLFVPAQQSCLYFFLSHAHIFFLSLILSLAQTSPSSLSSRFFHTSIHFFFVLPFCLTEILLSFLLTLQLTHFSSLFLFLLSYKYFSPLSDVHHLLPFRLNPRPFFFV